MLNKKLLIVNMLGLHARAAAKFVDCAGRYGAKIEIIRDTQRINGKSILGVMLLAAKKGTEIELQVEGEDENEAMQALEQLINNKFGEAE